MDLSLVSPLGAEHLEDVLELFRHEWWTKSRSRADVEHLVAGSTTTVGLIRDSRVVGFARVLSDGRVVALVLDVLVDNTCRGQGLGDRLMEAVLSLPEVASVDSVELVCQPDLVAFYERHGFATSVGRSTLMRRTSNPALRS